jgi:uncharacterized protein (DUF934 family)
MPRRLLRNGAIVTDEWLTRSDGDVADDSPLMLSFAEWGAERGRWLARRGPLGVILAPADDVQKLVPDLGRLALAGAEFPTVSEGRGYTQGRLLRERWQFGGELRARGALQRDHVFLLARCGFDSIELPESELEGGVAALGTFTAAYQPANDRGLRAGLRHRGAAPLAARR